MFTGIITHTSEVESTKKVPGGLRITLRRPSQWTDLSLGESISINGTCLTVDYLNNDSFGCTLVSETLKKTIFGNQKLQKVHLERAMKAGERFGGHFVQGHIDCVGKVVSSEKAGAEVAIDFPAQFKKYVIDKGSIAINGVSLTIVEVHRNQLTVALIPYTLQHTNLGSLKVGDKVNLEFDMLGKYVHRKSIKNGPGRKKI
ncbi:riboflavin synthase [Candidatus Saccharibacteria bacterium]|nr:riboflavin synthase [Candidatus Saccharibacteria bacterium]